MDCIERGCRFYCSPDGAECRWLKPLVAESNYPEWEDLTELTINELAIYLETRLDGQPQLF